MHDDRYAQLCNAWAEARDVEQTVLDLERRVLVEWLTVLIKEYDMSKRIDKHSNFGTYPDFYELRKDVLEYR